MPASLLDAIFSHPTAAVGANVYVGVLRLGGCYLGARRTHRLARFHRQRQIATWDRPARRADSRAAGRLGRITIGEDSSIGDRAVVLADVGRHCVIGAGSVVTRPIPDYAIAVGVPARVIRFRNAADESAEDLHRTNGAYRKVLCRATQ